VISIPCTDKFRCFGMLCVYQIFLHGDEDGAIQSDPPLLGGSLDNRFPFLVIRDGMYVG
jgi:hypothetical protein